TTQAVVLVGSTGSGSALSGLTEFDTVPKATAGITATVSDVPPTLTLSGNSSVNQRATYTLNLASSEVGPEAISSWTITWGDGSAPQVVPGNPSSVTHVYAVGPNNYTISATATDEDGTYPAGNTVAVTVNNVVPTLSSVSITSPIGQGSPAMLTGVIS